MKRYKYLLYFKSKKETEWKFTMSVTENKDCLIPSKFVDEICKIVRLGFDFKIETEERN